MSCNLTLRNAMLEYCDERQIVNIEENGVRYRGMNPQRKTIANYKVDNERRSDNRKRCDYLLLNSTDEVAYFIELKGCDLLKAVEQLEVSIDEFKSSLSDYRINGRIVLSRVSTHDLKNSKFIKLQKRLKVLGGDLQQKVKELQEIL